MSKSVEPPAPSGNAADDLAAVSALIEGNSIRATVRMTGVAKNTIVKLLADIGTACAAYQDKAFRDLGCKRIQADEIWSFVGSKAKNTTPEKREKGAGDVWTWVAIDADSKLVPSWLVSPDRELGSAITFMNDLAARVRNRIQLTTDGLGVYPEAVEVAFSDQIDFAQIIKVYGNEPTKLNARYSPAVCKGTRKIERSGSPDDREVSTSFVERQNLTMRMQIRRFTRLTNGFSKKIENHMHAVALHFMHYNFCRIHQSLRVTPAMAAGVSDHVWEIEDLVVLLDTQNTQASSN